MAFYTTDLTIVQWAREATPGVDLPTTSKMIVEDFRPTPSSPEPYRPELSVGLMQRYRGGSTIIQRGSNWTASGPLTFEQAQNLFAGAIVDVTAPTGDGPYVWTHTRNNLVVPTVATYTLERRITEGVNPIDQAFHHAMISELELTFARNDVWKYNATGFARRQKDEALTPAITLPAFETCLVPGSSIFIDNSWATLGTTQIVGSVISGSVKFSSGFAPYYTVDGREDLDFGVVAANSARSFFEGRLVMLVTPAVYAAEKAAAEAQATRALRIQIDGSDASRQIQIDALVTHRTPELFAFGEDDEMYTIEMDFVEATDATNSWRAKVTNNVDVFA